MTLILVPNNLFSIIGMVSICEPAPELPTRNCLLKRSSQVRMFELLQATQMPEVALIEPIQLNLRGSNFAAFSPYTGAYGTLEWISAMTLPSLGAAEWRYLVARKPPAPGMYCTTIFGSPGMCAAR